MFGEEDEISFGVLSSTPSTSAAANFSETVLWRVNNDSQKNWSSSGGMVKASEQTTLVLSNAMECICSDLQHDDYSPLYAWFNYIVIIIMLPSLSVFGVLTNIVNVFIYSRKRMNNSSNTYLLFLSCSDFMVILTGLFIFWIDSARSYIPELVRAPYTTVYTLPFGYMAQTCSIYFTVAAAFDCYVAVCWRRSSHRYCTTRRARQVVGTITIASVLYNSLRFPQFNLRKCFHDGSQELVIEICPTSLFFAINTIYNVYMYMVLMTLLPFLLLLVLNAFIVVKQSLDNSKRKKKLNFSKMVEGNNQCKGLLLKSIDFPPIADDNTYQKMEKNVQPLDLNKSIANTTGFSKSASPQSKTSTPKKTSSCSSGAKTSADDTITMIMVVVLFLSCNTLALIVNLIETFFEPDALLLNLLSDASNFLVVFNSSVNCVIYLIFNTEYREVFLIHFIQVKQYFRVNVFGWKVRRNLSSQHHQPTVSSLPTAERLLYRSPNRVGTAINGKHVTGTLDEDGECGGESYFCSSRGDNQSPIWQPCNSPAWISAEAAESELTNGFCLDEYISEDVKYRILPESDTQFSFDPSNSEMLEMVDDDSGWDERSSTMVVSSPNRPQLNEDEGESVPSNFQTSYLAEVKINHSPNAHQPHIFVRPISSRYINNNNNKGNNNVTVKAKTSSTGDLSITVL